MCRLFSSKVRAGGLPVPRDSKNPSAMTVPPLRNCGTLKEGCERVREPVGLKRPWELGRAEHVLNVALREAHERVKSRAVFDDVALWAVLRERSYAYYWALLRHDLGDPWESLGLRLTRPLPGSLSASTERRAPRGEYIRRFTLPVIGRDCGLTVARLLVDFAHSHTRFDVPRPPQVRLVCCEGCQDTTGEPPLLKR